MDLHVYRTSQDRWHDLSAAARERGAVLAVNAVTFHELVQRLTSDVVTATVGQRLAVLQEFRDGGKIRTSEFFLRPEIPVRYLYDAITELKSSRVRPHELRTAGAEFLGDILEQYDNALRQAGIYDPQDRCALAAARVKEGTIDWLQRFQRVVLHALYDLTEAEFILVRSIIETLPEGGVVVLFNATANVKPTQFAEWTWQRFIQDESLAEKTFPEFCRSAQPSRALLEKLFVFEPHVSLPADHWLQIVEASSRYREAEKIGGDIGDLLASGESANDVAVVVRHIETYGEILEDVFTRYGIPHRFETGVPLLRVPFIKYWLAVLDLVTNERSREAMARVMSSAYFSPRLSPAVDVDRALASFGYIDRNHMRASALAARKNSPFTVEIERFEKFLDELEASQDTVWGFMSRLQPSASLNERDRQAWRVLEEEIAAVGEVYSSGGARSRLRSADRPGANTPLQFPEFRRIASEIASLRTVDRTAATAPGLPRVRVIHPHSLGSREYKWIFALGCTDGEFPARSSSNPLLSDSVVEAINKRIRPRRLMTARDRNRREPLYLFMILDSATRRVTLTFPGSTLEGDPMYPSVYIGEIGRHYAESPIVLDTSGPPRSDGEWRSRIAEEWRRGTLLEDRARALLGDDIVERAKLEAKGIQRAHIAGGMPVDGVWHPSELNSLSSCPFVFLARHRLKLRGAETPDFEVPALEIGILAHAILRDFYADPVPSSLEEARMRMNEIIASRLSGADVNGQGPHSVFDPSLWKIRRRQLVSVLNRYVDFAAKDALDGFQTQPEYLDTPLPPLAMGSTLLSGRPDHVAVRRRDGQIAAIRIDDFKYSAASSTTARQLKDSFQIPIYAYLAAHALDAPEGVGIEGRYLLLRSPGNPVVAQTIDKDVFEEVRQRIEALMEKVREGRLEPEPADKQSCIDCEYRRFCRLYGI
jgi:PD-(D/E)XK nuclease superfamily/UvrD-like helicase C-terminal domain